MNFTLSVINDDDPLARMLLFNSKLCCFAMFCYRKYPQSTQNYIHESFITWYVWTYFHMQAQDSHTEQISFHSSGVSKCVVFVLSLLSCHVMELLFTLYFHLRFIAPLTHDYTHLKPQENILWIITSITSCLCDALKAFLVNTHTYYKFGQIGNWN